MSQFQLRDYNFQGGLEISEPAWSQGRQKSKLPTSCHFFMVWRLDEMNLVEQRYALYPQTI